MSANQQEVTDLKGIKARYPLAVLDRIADELATAEFGASCHQALEDQPLHSCIARVAMTVGKQLEKEGVDFSTQVAAKLYVVETLALRGREPGDFLPGMPRDSSKTYLVQLDTGEVKQAAIDDSRQYAAEGRQWRVAGVGVVDRDRVVGWRLAPPPQKEPLSGSQIVSHDSVRMSSRPAFYIGEDQYSALTPDNSATLKKIYDLLGTEHGGEAQLNFLAMVASLPSLAPRDFLTALYTLEANNWTWDDTIGAPFRPIPGSEKSPWSEAIRASFFQCVRSPAV